MDKGVAAIVWRKLLGIICNQVCGVAYSIEQDYMCRHFLEIESDHEGKHAFEASSWEVNWSTVRVYS